MSLEAREYILEINDQQEMVGICGRNDELLRSICGAYPGQIIARGNHITICGENAEDLVRFFQELLFLYRQGLQITVHDIRYGLFMMREKNLANLHQMYADTIITTNRGRQVKAKTLGQMQYVETIRRNFITLGIGPAGTGKTYLAVAFAVAALRKKEVERIILTRPAVEAGEKLGFLPGDLQEKVNPYLRPLYDGLYEMLGMETFQKYLSRGIIEVAPLAYMRGRTLNDACIILDEAQNTTSEQMKMAITRFGFGSKMIVTGDVTQIDLPVGIDSGLKKVARILEGVPGIGIVTLSECDVVRHEIVGAVIKAYEKFEQQSVAEEEHVHKPRK
ncbi:MAG: PhoH family protein [Phascolarctobacterium sp.]|nr:PhoH family protein [Phascolarctobacterium sp.]